VTAWAPSAGAKRGKVPRQRRHSWHSWQCGLCNLQNLKNARETEFLSGLSIVRVSQDLTVARERWSSTIWWPAF
jgi:hypothetical protein